MRPVITLLTDYGPGTEHVGALHAVIVTGCPAADRIDLAHDIPPGDVLWGGLLLAQLAAASPVGTHLAVVDPGVGTTRRSVAIACEDGRVLVGPDNGLLMFAADRFGARAAVVVAAPPDAAATFHGRDVFAPACARLASGVGLASLGSPVEVESLIRVPIPVTTTERGRIETCLLGIDRFGNLALAAGPQALAAAGIATGDLLRVSGAAAALDARVARTFADVASGVPLVYVDAHGLLAVSINGGNAHEQLSVKPAETIILALHGR